MIYVTFIVINGSRSMKREPRVSGSQVVGREKDPSLLLVLFLDVRKIHLHCWGVMVSCANIGTQNNFLT